MAIQKRMHTIDDVREMQRQSGIADRHYELIEGELVEMSPANLLHAWLASKISRQLDNYSEERDLGATFVEGGFYPPNDRHTLLAPDVAFVSNKRLPRPMPQTFVGFMPDLAVEIMSPSNTVIELREKAAIYLQNGTRMVWIVKPEQEGVEVCRSVEGGQIKVDFVGVEGSLSGEDVLPGFELALRKLFPVTTEK